jgi:hypothetical protein
VYNVAVPAEPSPEPLPLSPPSPARPSPGAAAGLPPQRMPSPPPGIPRTEQELNSPSRLTVRLLGVIFLATFLPWVAAKIACNVREAPPRQPPALSAEVLSRQPKDAAIELQQLAATGNYREAAEYARGDAARDLLEAEARCQADAASCAALRAPGRRVSTRAVLVARDITQAEVRVESDADGKLERYVLRLQPDTGRWYVMSRAPFAGELGERLPLPLPEAASAH